MDEILRQLGELLFGAIPTIVLLIVLNVFYRLLVHKPLQKTLFERRERTEGAVSKAQANIATAEARTAEYEQRLREARLDIVKAQERRRHRLGEARASPRAEGRTSDETPSE